MKRDEENAFYSIMLAVLIFCAASCAALAVITKAFGNTIYMPQVGKVKVEPTIAVDVTATPFVSVGGPWVGPTQTPTVTPPAPEVQP